MKRISWRNNFDMKISNRISLTANVGIIDEKRQLVDESGMATGTVYTAMGGILLLLYFVIIWSMFLIS